MLDSVIGAFLDAVSEREFDAPFMAILRAMGFYDVHFTHGSVEFGKDFIAKKDIDGNQYQYAFQTKAVPIAFPKIQNQLDVLRTSTLSHPAFLTTRQLRPVLVTTRRLLGPALEHTEHERRPDSYMASVVLDLASVLQLEEVFETARNEFLAVGCLPSVLLSPDTGDQYMIHGKDLRTEPNPNNSPVSEFY